MRKEDWELPGSDDQPVLGTAHHPPDHARAVIVLSHGFLGYKEYGMFPRLGSCAAAAGFILHRFNFSHSGMTNEIDTFARPDLLERDTWNRQVQDLRRVCEGIRSGQIAGQHLPVVLVGHSRGGVTSLLVPARDGAFARSHGIAGVVTCAAPSTCMSISREEIDDLMACGYLERTSSRTGQVFRFDRTFVDEQRADPPAHDLLALAGDIEVPVLILHGEDDETVHPAAAEAICRAVGDNARIDLIPGGNHVFNVPNPLPAGEELAEPAAAAFRAILSFVGEVSGEPGSVDRVTGTQASS